MFKLIDSCDRHPIPTSSHWLLCRPAAHRHRQAVRSALSRLTTKPVPYPSWGYGTGYIETP